MLVYVTGASGHVGGAIARGLAAAGHRVIGLSRRPIAPDGVHAVALDLGTAGALEHVDEDGPDAIVHAAACLSKEPLDTEIVDVNGRGTLAVAQLAAAHDAHVVYISGVPVIGEPRAWPITEEHPTSPKTTYHASKLFGEHLLAAARPGGVTTLRVSSPVGPGMPDGRILSHFAAQALAGAPLRLAGEGSRRQDYVDVRDVAAVVTTAVLDRVAGTFNIASGRAVSNLELARECVDVLGSRSSVELTGTADPEEGVSWDVSIDKAAKELGYRPSTSLRASIEAVAEERREPRDG